jgi:hypothetical protein
MFLCSSDKRTDSSSFNLCFENNQQNEKSFVIEKPPSHIPDEEVLEALHSLLSLFNDSEQIEINYQNKSAYLFLSLQFDNTYLKLICLQVNVNSSQNFSFTSERFLYIHQRTLSTLFDFTVYINKEPFLCNSVFVSCLSRTIFDLKYHDSSVQEIHFNDINFDNALLSLFQMLNGHSFLFSSSDIN